MHILVINLQRRLGNDYPIVVELTASGVYLPTRVEGVLRPETDPGRDFSTFKAHLKVLSPKDYGTALGKAVFRDAVRDAFLEARRASDGKLHVLIFVEDSELQSLHWERLCAPAKASWEFLALDDSLPFSLYLPSVIDWRFRPIGRLDLRALVVIASPKDDDKRWGLLPFDVAKAAGIAKAALGKIPCDLLAFSEGAVGPPTFEALRGRIASESYTLLHIVCHGRHIPKTGETVLYLASNDNQVDAVNGGRLIERLANLRGARGLPHFTFLSSCESAAPATGDALGGLAQRLVRDLGMPAVLAMTDLISVDTAQELTRRFYEYLWSHGEVDGALSQACAVLADRDDINVPILYTRLEGKPLFSDSLAERSLSEAEIKNGLDKAATHLAQRSPVLLPTLEAQKALLGPSAPAEDRPRALATLNRLCERAIDLSFNDLAQGKLPPEYDDRCPFRGLYPFRPEDKEFFFGREELVGRLQGRLAEGNFLAVLGASGSGKSSLVLAGLVPALREQNPKLRWAYMTPGSSPVEFLEVSLKVNEGASLLIVDQFEEAFTQCMDEAKRRVFLERVLELQKEMRVVLTMRADFWGECAPHRELASLMQSRQELVAAMDADELRRAMEKQVQKVGLRFEADLSTTVLEEVQGEPGAMPLLQHALLELWKRRHGRWLQAEEYRAIGGVRKAIAQTAETFYRELSPADQVHVRDIFLRLTKVGDERDTRQRVPLSKLTPVGADANEIQRLVKRLANEGVRLLVSDENRTTKRVEVEVAHEALIRYWPRLHDWLNQRRDLLLIRQVVGQAACDWTQSDCDRTFLLHRAKRLEQAQGLRSAQVLPLTNEENEYLNACQKADRLGKWLTYGGASLLAALIVGIVAMGWKDALDKADLLKKDADRLKEIATLNEKRAEEAETAAAEQGRLLLESRRGEYAANCNFIAQQLERANITTVVERLQSMRGKSKDLLGFEWYRFWKMAHNHELELPTGISAGVAFGPDLSLLTAAQNNQLTLWDRRAGTPSYQQKGHSLGILSGIVSMAYCPKTGEVATSGNGDSAVTIWEAKSGKLLRTLSLDKIEYSRNTGDYLQFSEAGDLLAVSLQASERNPEGGLGTLMGYDLTAAVLDAKNGSVKYKSKVSYDHANIVPVALTRDGSLFALGKGRSVLVAKIGAKEEPKLIELSRDYATSLAFSPNGKILMIGGEGVTLWDLEKTQQKAYFDSHQTKVTALAVSHDGKLVASAGQDQTVKLWNTTTLSSAGVLMGHRGSVTHLAFSPDSQELATGSRDGTVKVWDVRRAVRGWVTDGSRCAFSADGQTMVTWQESRRRDSINANIALDTVKVVDTASWTEFASGVFSKPKGAFFGPGDSKLVVQSHTHLHLLDSRTLMEVAAVPGSAAAFHPRSGELIVLNDQKALQIVSPEKGEVRQPDGIEPLQTPAAACFVKGDLLVVGNKQGLVVFDSKTWKITREIPVIGGVESLSASPKEGKYLLTVSSKRADLWDVTNWEKLGDFRPASWDGFAFDPTDASIAIIEQRYDRVTVRDLPSFKPKAVGVSAIGWVTAVTFSPDGKRIATGGLDNTVRLWDIASGQHLLSLESGIGGVMNVVFSPDGRALVSTHSQAEYRRVRLWEAASDDDVELHSKTAAEKAAFRVAVGQLMHQAGQAVERVKQAGGNPDQPAVEGFVGRRLLKEAIGQMESGDLAAAEKTVRTASRLNSEWSNRAELLASRLLRMKREGQRDRLLEVSKLAYGKVKADWEMCLSKVDGILAKDPTFAAPYFYRGVAQFQLGNDEAAIADWLSNVKFEEKDRFAVPGRLVDQAYYKLACVASVRASKPAFADRKKELVDEAFRNLDLAIRAGFNAISLLPSASDLNAIRADPRFGELLKRLK